MLPPRRATRLALQARIPAAQCPLTRAPSPSEPSGTAGVLIGRPKTLDGRAGTAIQGCRDSITGLRHEVSVDVLIDAARVRAGVGAPSEVGIEGPALVHVCRHVVLVLDESPRVGALHCVAPVRPDTERVVTERGHPQVLSGE